MNGIKSVDPELIFITLHGTCKECGTHIKLQAKLTGEWTYNTCYMGHSHYMKVEDNNIVIEREVTCISI